MVDNRTDNNGYYALDIEGYEGKTLFELHEEDPTKLYELRNTLEDMEELNEQQTKDLSEIMYFLDLSSIEQSMGTIEI